MKVKPEHYEHMRDAIQAVAHRIPATKEAIASDSRVKDAAKRLRWDMCYMAGLNKWICDNLYSYMDDTHIDTALRRIMSEIS